MKLTGQNVVRSARNQILCYLVLTVPCHHVRDVLAEERVDLHLGIVEGVDGASDVLHIAASVIDVAVFRLVGADGVHQV